MQLEAERDIISLGEIPRITVNADAPNPTGGYYTTSAFTVRNPDGTENDGPCDAARRPSWARGFAALDFECHPLTQVGVHTIRFEPARSGIAGEPVELAMRVVEGAPLTPPAPPGWTAVPLWEGTRRLNCNFGPSHMAAIDHERLVKAEAVKAEIPALLANRMSEEHARAVNYVFESDDGWIVMFDRGEFGGGIEWFARAGGERRSIVIGARTPGETVPQNVNRALLADGGIYVLQGIAHGGTNEGQLAKIWRAHDQFSSHVLARYASEPVDWIRREDGTSFVVTWDAIWQTREGAPNALVSRLPEVVKYPASLARAADGTFFVGTRGGALRLTPTWPEAPRYAADFLLETGNERSGCLRNE